MAGNPHLLVPRPGAPVTFMPVPASLFRHGRRPPFVLFDAHQRLLGADRAETVYVSPGDQPALATFVARHLPTFVQDAGIPWTDTAWAVFHTFSSEVARVYGYAPGRVPEPHLAAATDAVLMLARSRPAAVLRVAEDAGAGALAEAVTRALLTALLAIECAYIGGPLPRDIVLGAVFAKIGDDLVAGAPSAIEDPTAAHDTTPRDTMAQEGRRYTLETLNAQHPAVSAVTLRAALHHGESLHRATPATQRRAAVPAEARMVAITAAFTAQHLLAASDEGLASFAALERITRDPRFDPDLLRAFVRAMARAQAAAAATPGTEQPVTGTRTVA